MGIFKKLGRKLTNALVKGAGKVATIGKSKETKSAVNSATTRALKDPVFRKGLDRAGANALRAAAVVGIVAGGAAIAGAGAAGGGGAAGAGVAGAAGGGAGAAGGLGALGAAKAGIGIATAGVGLAKSLKKPTTQGALDSFTSGASVGTPQEQNSGGSAVPLLIGAAALLLGLRKF